MYGRYLLTTLFLAEYMALPLFAQELTAPLHSITNKSAPVGTSTYDPSFDIFARQTIICEAGYSVVCEVYDGCCRSGQHCCNNAPGCCENGLDCITMGTLDACCPTVSERCGGSQCCEPGSTCCANVSPGAGCCSPGETCCGNSCCRSPAMCSRNAITGELGCMLPDISEPIEFDANVNPDLAENLCRALRARDVIGNEEVLTKHRSANQNDISQIRLNAKCRGRTKCAAGFSCYEYPPASTEEGLNGDFGEEVFTCCIESTENTAGGRQLSSLYGKGLQALSAGSTFVVGVTGLNCSGAAPATPSTCGPTGGTQQNQGRATIIYPPLKNDPSGYTLAAFGDLDPAQYQLTLSSNVDIDLWEIIDSPALTIASGDIIRANEQTTLDFVVEQTAFGVGLVAFTLSRSIDLKWSMLSTPLGSEPPPSIDTPSHALSREFSPYFSALLIQFCVTMAWFSWF